MSGIDGHLAHLAHDEVTYASNAHTDCACIELSLLHSIYICFLSSIETVSCETDKEIDGVGSVRVWLGADVVVFEDDQGLRLVVLFPGHLTRYRTQVQTRTATFCDRRTASFARGSFVGVSATDKVDGVGLHVARKF